MATTSRQAPLASRASSAPQARARTVIMLFRPSPRARLLESRSFSHLVVLPAHTPCSHSLRPKLSASIFGTHTVALQALVCSALWAAASLTVGTSISRSTKVASTTST